MPTESRPSSSPATTEDPNPRTRPRAAALIGLEALLLVAVATYCFIGVSSGALAPRFGTGLGVFLVLFAVGLGLAARSLLAKGRFGLGFGITWQFFQALTAASMLRSGLYWQGALGLLLAAVVFVLLTRLVRSTPLPGEGS